MLIAPTVKIVEAMRKTQCNQNGKCNFSYGLFLILYHNTYLLLKCS